MIKVGDKVNGYINQPDGRVYFSGTVTGSASDGRKEYAVVRTSQGVEYCALPENLMDASTYGTGDNLFSCHGAGTVHAPGTRFRRAGGGFAPLCCASEAGTARFASMFPTTRDITCKRCLAAIEKGK